MTQYLVLLNVVYSEGSDRHSHQFDVMYLHIWQANQLCHCKGRHGEGLIAGSFIFNMRIASGNVFVLFPMVVRTCPNEETE